MSIRSKVENIWYHYKSFIIVGVILLGILIFSLHSCVTKPEYDLYIYYVTGSTPVYEEQKLWLETAVGTHCGDVNGDGEVKIAVTHLRVDEGMDASERIQYMAPLQAGEVMLLFGDEEGINFLHQNGYLQPLTDFSHQLDGEGYAWKVSGSPFSSETEGFSDLFGDANIYMSLRIFDDTWSSARSEVKENYENACNTIRSIVAVPAPEVE